MKYLIFLRGINVGGRNIRMQDLKHCLENSGFQNVHTVLQSGNIIIDAKSSEAKLELKIEETLKKCFSYEARVFVIQVPDLKKVVDKFPFEKAGNTFHKYIIFTKNGFEKEFVKHAPAIEKEVEMLVAGDGVIYWCVQKGETLTSVIGKYLDKVSAKHFTTTRNINTLQKVLIKAQLQA